MSTIWYPGIDYCQYLQENSFTRDITGQVKSSSRALEIRVSEQTKALVASNQQLAREFGDAFNSTNSTLAWGLSRIEYILQDVNASIESLHADFNYSMGLLLEEIYIHNELLKNLLGKLDAIHKTLKSPMLNQAREFYNIGCERLSKGLLDKALEAFIQAENKNDADFFTQFHMGKLYLYGIDEDDNVLDLEKAKKHLLLASRFAKAEISIDHKFARFAAEALLHASIAIYAQLGDKALVGNAKKTKQLLEEARDLATEAIELLPELFLESYYHVAKYSALLKEPSIAIPNLELAIETDRNYAVKVDLDRAFDPIRPQVLALLSELKDAKKLESKKKLKQVLQLLKNVSQWHLEESKKLASQFEKCKKDLSNAQELIDSQTYFGFLDAILLLDPLIILLPQIKSDRIDELKNQVSQLIHSTEYLLPHSGEYSLDVENIVESTNKLIGQAKFQLNQDTYKTYTSAFKLVQSAKLEATKAYKLAQEEDDDIKRCRQEEAKAIALRKEKNERSKYYARRGAMLSGLTGCLVGCVSHIYGSDINIFSGTIIGVIVGAVIGAIIGQIIRD